MINRNNYEEYFLLYIDGELNDEQRSAVELFIKDNPDLQAELTMLQQATLSAGDITFGNKDLLKQNESISLHNYQDYFLLSVDNELKADEQQKVETFVLQNPALQQDYTSLQKTKLTPEVVAHPNKAELYKKERRVVPIYFLRISVAAAVLAIAVSTWFLTNKNQPNNTNPTIAINQPKQTQPTTTVSSLKNQIILQQQQSVADVIRKDQHDNTTTINQPHNLAAITPTRNQKPETRNEKQETPNQKPETTPEDLASISHPQPIEDITAPPILKQPKEVKTIAASLASNDQQSTTNDQPNIIHNASYKLLPETNDDDNTVYIASLPINKNKLKSLFKKATAIFGHKNSEDKSVKVASFEIRST